MITCYQDRGFMRYDSNKGHGSVADIGAALWVDSIIQNVDSSQVFARLRFNDHKRQTGEMTIEVKDFYESNSSMLGFFARYGLFYARCWENSICDYLIEQLNKAQSQGRIELRHTTLGWQLINGKYAFLYYENTLNGRKSYYFDTKFPFKSGNRQVYEQLLNDIVWPTPTLTIAMAIGLSSVVNSRMRELIAPESIIVNLCGASSTGKTTAEALMVSAFARPIPSNTTGLMHTFNATENALYSSITGIHGLPMVLDDTTTNMSMNIPRLLYSLSSNQDKARCQQDGTLKSDSRQWSGTIILSSETPIHELQSENQGLKVRVLHTQGITWTPDAQRADRIKNVIQSNYGHIGYEFAQYVERFDDAALLDRYNEALDMVKRLMTKQDALSDRIARKYAVIAATLALMQEHFALTIDVESHMQILLKPEQDSVEDRDIAKKALDAIVAFVIKKRQNMNERYRYTDEDTPADRTHSGDDYGTIVHLKGRDMVYIPVQMVKEVLTNANIIEHASVFTKWKERNIIHTEHDRNDVKFTASKSTPYFNRRCICFVFEGELQSDVFRSDYPSKQIIDMTDGDTPVCSDVYDDSDSLRHITDDE